MYLIFVLLFLISGGVEAKFSVEDSVSLGGGFDTNPLFSVSNNSMDYMLRVDPHVDLVYDKSSFYTKIGGGLEYNKYFKTSNQSYAKWNFDSLVSIRPEESTTFDLVNNYDNNSDPILVDTETRAKWNLYTMRASLNYITKSKLWHINGDFESYSTRYDDDTYQNFNNNKRYIVVSSKFFFFPETAFIMGYKGGYSFYTAGYNAKPYGNSDSVYSEGFVGLDGQITDSVAMYLKLGFLYLDYQHGESFHEPVIELRATNYITKLDTLSAVFERMAYDSVYSNFYVDNKIGLEFKNVWYDNYVNLTNFQYIYRYYRLWPKRVDHRISFVSELAFPVFVIDSIKENISFFTRFMAEWVNSDAYNSFKLYNGPDPAASYRRFVLLVGFTTKY